MCRGLQTSGQGHRKLMGQDNIRLSGLYVKSTQLFRKMLNAEAMKKKTFAVLKL